MNSLHLQDEKYIAVAFSGSSKDVGAVVIYNFLKSKIKVNAPTGAITSLAWSHQGDVLYAGEYFFDRMLLFFNC